MQNSSNNHLIIMLVNKLRAYRVSTVAVLSVGVLAVVVGGLPPVALAQDSAAPAADVIRKSPNDPREYRAITLENGLRAVLIHDPETEKAAASLDVPIGSGSDPAERQGLAHFLEHMLFLGTKKYPDAGEYSGFIRKHGGFNNAFTSFEDTNYHFDVEAEYLEPALDRFAQFFIAPLFTKDLVDREKNAVHSEFSGKRREDGRRVWAARRMAYNPDHPIAQFSTGSLETLADRDDSKIRDELIAFYEKHYSANIMTLAVYGREGLDSLEAMVREKFGSVENRQSKMQKFDLPLYLEENMPQRLDVQALKDQRYMSMNFEIENKPAYKESKPNQIIGHLLGHEGEGSLLSALKKRGYADSLSAGGNLSDRGASTFGINIGLTPAGLRQVDTITEMVFGAIALIKKEGVEKWHHDEQKKLTEIGFRFQEKGEPSSTVISISRLLHEWPAADVLIGPYEVKRFDPAHLRNLLDQLEPSGLMLTVVSPGATTDLFTQFFETPYTLNSIDDELVRRWREAKPSDDIKLPQENPFIPEELDLVASKETGAPERLESVDGVELWHQTDTSFNVPRANFYVSIRSDSANASARSAVLSELYVRLVNERLNEFTYPASLAGLGYDLYRHVRGFSCRISGYSDGQEQILERIFEAIAAPEFEQQQFERIRDELIREITDSTKQPPYEQTISQVREMLRDPYWSDDAQIEAARSISADDVKKHAQSLLENVVPVALSHGNVTPEQSIARAKLVRKYLGGDLTERDIPKPAVVKLQQEQAIGRELAIEHNDSAITIYAQADDDSIETRAKLALLTQMMSQPFYDEIRTRQQLGYFVFASQLYVMEVPGVMFSVQSPQSSVEKMVGRVGQFLTDFRENLKDMSDQEFQQHRAGVMSQLVEPDKRLRERSERFWREIDRKQYEFDSRDKFASALEATDQADILALYESLLLDKSRGRVTTWSRGKLATETDETIEVKMPATLDDIEKFKQAQEHFPASDSSS